MENKRRKGSKHQRDGRDKENVNRGKEDSEPTATGAYIKESAGTRRQSETITTSNNFWNRPLGEHGEMRNKSIKQNKLT